MNILLCSDLAGRLPTILPEDLAIYDLVLIAGDVTLGAKSEKVAQTFMEKLGKMFPAPKPVYLIPGNHDYAVMAQQQPWFPPNFIQMHNKISINSSFGLRLIGFGGAKIGILNNFAFDDAEIYARLNQLFKVLQNPITNVVSTPMVKILFVHDPPFNSKLDYTYTHEHVGSQSIRQIIEKYQPDLAVAGHIHESIGKDKIGNTICVNAGEAKNGHYAMIRIENGVIDIKFRGTIV